DELRASMIFLADEIEDLAKISEKLLRIAELESSTRRKKFETVSLNKIARDVVDLYEAVAEEQQASLLFSSTGKPDVHGDPDLLAGAIANLLDNSIKYAGGGARIHLAVTEASGEVTVSVTDNGPGISPSKHQRIGERFYRLNSDVPGY